MPTLESFKKHLQKNVDAADAAMTKFKADLSQNPAHAFKWGDNVMALVSRGDVARLLLAWANKWESQLADGSLSDKQPQNEDEFMERALEHITKTALQKNRWTNQSTSMCSNFMERTEAAAYAELADEWNMIW